MKKSKKYYNWEYVVWAENLESIQQLNNGILIWI